jgi:hypothetical protein
VRVYGAKGTRTVKLFVPFPVEKDEITDLSYMLADSSALRALFNTNGRVEIYSRMAQEATYSVWYLGKGLGVVEKLLECWNISKFANLHNDLLKFYIELGVLGLAIYLTSYLVMFYFVGKNYGNAKMSFILAISIYTVLLFATDNVSIYVMYLFPMYSVFFAVLSEQRTEKIQG